MITFKKVREVKSPERSGKNAGYDLFVPEFNEKFVRDFVELNSGYFESIFYRNTDTNELIAEIMDNEFINLDPIFSEDANHFNIKIPSGIQYKLTDTKDKTTTRKFQIENKSGVASKHSLMVGACVCDMEYRDEVLINIIGFKQFRLTPNFKIVQGYVSIIDISEVNVIEYNDTTSLYDEDDIDRGGGFGSTGN